jgi:hypothetical protein
MRASQGDLRTKAERHDIPYQHSGFVFFSLSLSHCAEALFGANEWIKVWMMIMGNMW